MFMGEYSYTLDTKGRIIIPAKLRNELGNNFIITRGLDNCLYIYSNTEFNNIINKYKSLPDSMDKRNFMRVFLSGAITCGYDKQGRVNIPQSLLTYASLKNNCFIVGVYDHLEIWSKENWDKFMDLNSSNMSLMADNLFINN